MAVRLLDTGDAVQQSQPRPVQEFLRQPVDEAAQAASGAQISEPTSEIASDAASDKARDKASDTTSDTATEATSEAIAPTAGYVPAAELSERPVLLQDLDPVLEWPASVAAPEDAAGTAEIASLSSATGILLINPQGSVDRLLFDPPGYPRYLEAMLALRFAEVRFRPGKVDGKPVPSALRIIVQLQ